MPNVFALTSAAAMILWRPVTMISRYSKKKEVVKKICCSTKYNEEFAARLDVVRPAALCSSSSSSMKAWTTASMPGSAAKASAGCGAAVSLFRATLGYVTNLS
jgi:hypothetical protein